MINLQFRSLTEWKDKGDLGRARVQFRSTYSKTLKILEYELRKLGAADIVIEAGYAPHNIRNDGQPKAGAPRLHPGVVLYFRTTDGDLRFPCGTYQTFEANLHAIALTLTSLRAIDRYGATMGHQQYLGFKAIAAPEPKKTVDEAAADLEGWGATKTQIIENEEAYRQAYRRCARNTHPDQNPGEQEAWEHLQTIRMILDAHHQSRRSP